MSHQGRTLHQLLERMRRLRHPEKGCAWVRAQTAESIAPITVEEAYEVKDAVQSNDVMGLKGELGDLLYHVLFYAQLASEKNLFDFGDVLDTLENKLVTRHPHVFGNQKIDDIETQQHLWESIKHEARQSDSILDDIPTTFPALMRAQKLQKRAASIGFDWKETEEVLTKLDEERDELNEAFASYDSAAIADEIGDCIFTLVNLSRRLGFDAEIITQNAAQKFEKRFRSLERSALDAKQSLETLSVEELDVLWQAAKERVDAQ